MKRPPLLVLAVLASLAAACGRSKPGTNESQASSAARSGTSGNSHGRVYERNFVFMTLTKDSAVIVPWLFTTAVRPGTEDREVRGYLARGAAWDPFYHQDWETPPSRAPWRILPHGNLHILVGDADAIEALLFEDGPRKLELDLSNSLITWTGMRGQQFQLLNATVYLADQRIPGIALDMSRARASEDARPGDWAFLVSGDSLQMVLENPTAASPGTNGAYRAWARLDFRDLHWPEVTVNWAEVRAYQPAHQDVPVSWTLKSDDANLGGTLHVVSAQIQAGQGTGPLLPVDALFTVSGTVRIQGTDYRVLGLFRHTRS
jgi:hypothetical protein